MVLEIMVGSLLKKMDYGSLLKKDYGKFLKMVNYYF